VDTRPASGNMSRTWRQNMSRCQSVRM
jgi:hypothetical protein